MKLFKKIVYAIICASLLVTSMGVQPVYAASFFVGDAASLIAAINTANINNQNDTISLTADITLTVVNNALNGLPVILADSGNSLVIEGNNYSISRSSAGGTPSFRILEIGVGANVTINDLTITNGDTIGDGGGILNRGTVTINNSIITGNIATTGSGRGGGISNIGILFITDSTVSNNSATFYWGGGIYNTDNITITNSIISENSSANSGGGLYIEGSGSATISNSTFSGNTSLSGGAGIFHNGLNLSITNSTFENNLASSVIGDGGGIYNLDSTVNISNSTFTGNSAGGVGAAIFSTQSAGATILNIINSTIANNTSGGGINVAGTTTLTNTIISNNTSGNCSGTITNGGNNIDSGATCGWGTASGSMSNTDPLLGALANNGGPTQTMALLSGSPAINTGNATACANSPVSGTDQRGVSRPQGAGCDIGAFEVDDTFPTVVSDSLVASYASGAGPSSFTVTFSENVYDPAGDTDDRDVTYLDNYLLVEDGANGVFDTTSCEGGLEIDDTQITIISVTYNAGLFTATINLNDAVPNGSYRLFVCGTTSINDLALNELNNGLTDYTFDFIVGTAVVTVPPVTASSLPDTGFAPNRITSLPHHPTELAYTTMGDIWLEIPSQNIKSNIVGIPQSQDNTWDVTWLGNDTGWLNGTAFPTWNGNSVLTAHVTDSNGLPGPFANLKTLTYGDQIIVHLFGQQYIYEVQNSRMTRPQSTSFAFESMQDYSYLTLITCQGYIPFSDSYFFRRVVRAVLVDVK